LLEACVFWIILRQPLFDGFDALVIGLSH
jgi:hypothetical protein